VLIIGILFIGGFYRSVQFTTVHRSPSRHPIEANNRPPF